MLHNLPMPADLSQQIVANVCEKWQFRLSIMTAEEQFYCVELLKFKAPQVTSKNIHYLALKVRLIRFLKQQEDQLFTEWEWESLAHLWRIRFLEYYLKFAAQIPVDLSGVKTALTRSLDSPPIASPGAANRV
jgi:hypothetical protein